MKFSKHFVSSPSKVSFLMKHCTSLILCSILQSHLIESIGWNKVRMNETTTGEIIIGTSKGMKCNQYYNYLENNVLLDYSTYRT